MTDQAGWETQLSVLEKNVYLDYFRKIDLDSKGIVLQDEAIPFLKMSAIPDNILMQFWNAADNDKKGFLTSQEFCILLKLIACAQHGVMTAEPILSTKVPLPDFSGNGTPRMQSTTGTPPPTTPSPASVPAASQDTITPEDRMKYIQLFQSFQPVNNTLSGEQARHAFMRSNLPPAILQAIWNLADTRRSGSLNQTEFIIAMHYIERVMKGSVQLPPSLPSNIYASATGRLTGASPLMRKNTLQVPNSPPPIPSRSPVFKGATVTPVDITPEEFNKYQVFFRQLDTDQSGYVTGADAVVFFKHSKLPESDLARIWDLADTRSTGQLNEQEFAIAMHLINRRIAGGEIPTHLPSFHSLTKNQSQTEQTIDLLGLSSDTPHDIPTSSTSQPPFLQQQQQQQQGSLERTQTLLKANIETETNRALQASQQWQTESQASQQLLQQIEEQKQLLAQKKKEADEAEQKLAAERKRKEELTKELQMYKQEVKHYNTRIEDMQQEAETLRKENQPSSSSSPPPSMSATSVPLNDFFSLSTTPQALDTKNTAGLFAKVDSEQSKDMPSAASPQPKFDPFAGFKQQQQQAASPTVSLNQLKQEAEAKKVESSPQLNISDIESKFPDLNMMEQNFPTSPKSVVSPKPEPTTTTSSSPFVKQQAPATSKSKDGFDFSAFESPSFQQDNNKKSNVKDDLSSLFGSPSLPAAEQKHGFDDVFNIAASQEQKNTFENIFMQK